MPRKRPPKEKGDYGNDLIKYCVDQVLGGKSAREVADSVDNKLSHATISRHVKLKRDGKDITKRITPGARVFTPAEEEELAVYLKRSSKMFCGLTLKATRQLAYKFALNLMKCNIPTNWRSDVMAGEDWLKGFRARRPDISLRSPEPTTIARATAFNKSDVNKFFQNLEEVMKLCEIPPQKIWNLDETGVKTVHNPGKVLAAKGVKQLGQLSSAERGVLVTMCCCVSASGQSLPPAYIFPRVHFKEHMLKGAPPGSKGLAASSGWMTSELFVEVLRHFIPYMNASRSEPSLLILDNHVSHVSLEVIKMAEEMSVHILTFPPHCSHKMQPLDVSVYGPFKRYYNNACESWMLQHPGAPITIYDVAELSATAYLKGMTPSNITAGFKATGISPLDKNIFPDDAFLSSSMFNTNENTTPGPEVARGGGVSSVSHLLSEEAGPSRRRSALPADPKAPPKKQTSRKRAKVVSRLLTSFDRDDGDGDSDEESEDGTMSVCDTSEAHSLTSSDSEDDEGGLDPGKYAVFRLSGASGRSESFVGRIIKIVEDGLIVSYLKMSAKGSYFSCPDQPDESLVDAEQVLKILPDPIVAGGTARRRAMLKFPISMEDFNISG